MFVALVAYYSDPWFNDTQAYIEEHFSVSQESEDGNYVLMQGGSILFPSYDTHVLIDKKVGQHYVMSQVTREDGFAAPDFLYIIDEERVILGLGTLLYDYYVTFIDIKKQKATPIDRLVNIEYPKVVFAYEDVSRPVTTFEVTDSYYSKEMARVTWNPDHSFTVNYFTSK